jgi:hypothetical protein
MISTSLDGGTITTYSPRFSLTGMTGIFAPAIERAARQVTGTHSLETQNNIVRRAADPQAAVPANPAAAPAIQASYALPYDQQDGPTKYAPMQGHAGTKITAVSASLRYPTSSYSVYKTFAPVPKQVTTQTIPVTFSTQSYENSVCTFVVDDTTLRAGLTLRCLGYTGIATDGCYAEVLGSLAGLKGRWFLFGSQGGAGIGVLMSGSQGLI